MIEASECITSMYDLFFFVNSNDGLIMHIVLKKNVLFVFYGEQTLNEGRGENCVRFDLIWADKSVLTTSELLNGTIDDCNERVRAKEGGSEEGREGGDWSLVAYLALLGL